MAERLSIMASIDGIINFAAQDDFDLDLETIIGTIESIVD
jgi:hypothetical protein